MHQEKFEEILENTTTFIIHTIRMVKVKQTSDMWCVHPYFRYRYRYNSSRDTLIVYII